MFLLLFDALNLYKAFHQIPCLFHSNEKHLVPLFDVLANQPVPEITIDQSRFYFALRFLFSDIKKLFTFCWCSKQENNTQERQTNDDKRRDVELLINFIIPSFSHRLLSAFEYFKYYSILSLCLL